MPLTLAFLLSGAAALFQSALLPGLGILSFAPFAALLCKRCSYPASLWLCMLAGLFSDLLASGPFGIHALCMTLTVAIVHRFRLRFFLQGEPLQLCLISAIFSAIYAPMQSALLFLFERKAERPLFDFFAMPIADAAYAFLWFVGPLLFYEWAARQWKLWILKKNQRIK